MGVALKSCGNGFFSTLDHLSHRLKRDRVSVSAQLESIDVETLDASISAMPRKLQKIGEMIEGKKSETVEAP